MPAPTSTARPVAAVVTASFLLGTTGTVAALGPEALGATTAAAWRTVIGAVALVALAATAGQAPWRYRLRTPWVLVGAVALAVNQVAFFEGMRRAGVAVGTIVMVGTMPIAAGVLDRFVQGRRATVPWLVGVVVAVAGVGLLVEGGGTGSLTGIGLAVVAGTAAPVVGLAAQRLMGDRPAWPAMATVVAGGAILLLPRALGDAGTAFGSPAAATTVLVLGIVTMAAAYALWGLGLARLGLAVAVAATLLEPAVAATLAATVLGEPFTSRTAAGIALVLVGVAAATGGGSGRVGRLPDPVSGPAGRSASSRGSGTSRRPRTSRSPRTPR